MRKKRIGYIILALIASSLVIGLIIYKKVINPDHREIAKETTSFTFDANDLQFHFLNNPEEATSKYVNMVVETYGKVTEVGSNLVILNERVQANFLESNNQEIKVGDSIKIKGRCIGFDEFPLLVKIDQANIIKTTNEN